MKINYRPLRKFMVERHSTALRRQVAPNSPERWTRDPIIKQYKFTNVYRELDRVTIWVRENIREPFAEHPNLWFMLCIARQINWPPTLQKLIEEPSRCAWPYDDGWSWAQMMRTMRKIAKRGDKLYTGAYMLTANAGGLLNKVPGKFDKPEITCKLVLNGVWKDRETLEPLLHSSMQIATEALKDNYTGFGGFMSYEVVCDLRYTRYLEGAQDKRTWAHAGPGALRGLNRLMGRGAKERPFLRTDEAVETMRYLLEKIESEWPYRPALELREIEHSLCEFDKYERARTGEGRPRSYFRPSTGGW